MKNFRKVIYLFIVSVITVDFVDSSNSSHSIIFASGEVEGIVDALEASEETGEELAGASRVSRPTPSLKPSVPPVQSPRPSVGKQFSKAGSDMVNKFQSLSKFQKGAVIAGVATVPVAAVVASVALKN